MARAPGVQARENEAMRSRGQGPDCRDEGAWAGLGSSHQLVEVVGGRERCFVANWQATGSMVQNPPEGACAVSLSEAGWGAGWRGIAGPRQMDLDTWVAQAEAQIAAAQPAAAGRVATFEVPAGLVVAAVGECDWVGPCCGSERVSREEFDLEAVQAGGERLRLLGEMRDCAHCGERRSSEVYASAVSAKEVGKVAGFFEGLLSGHESIVASEWPAVLLPSPAMFAEHAAAAIAAERLFDAERALDAVATIAAGAWNFAAFYDAEAQQRHSPQAVFDAVGEVCGHYGVSCVLATRRDFDEAMAQQRGGLGYRNEVVCRVDPAMTFLEDGAAHVQLSVGVVVSHGLGRAFQEIEVGAMELAAGRQSCWLSGGPVTVQPPRLAVNAPDAALGVLGARYTPAPAAEPEPGLGL